ncbi:inhibitor of apoptosis protein 3 [Choristoneura diversana nucleopolyhedrovirus]|nr:inhibitor of apoptosis protein 3 [Choristoneura diversana nucleopolyhedrovirus]
MSEQTVVGADEVNMEDENARLATYINWPVQFLEPQRLAANGFFYLGRGDEVRCAFCKVEIMRWEEGDDPARDHQRWAPQCPFLKKTAAGALPAGLAMDGQDECGVSALPSTNACVRMPGPAHPRFASEASRLQTFKDWPRSLKQKPEKMAEAGFYYTGHSDKTKCFYCDGALKDWEHDDEPWQQHALFFRRCAYVLLVKGHDYVQKVVTQSCVVRDTNKEQVDEPRDTNKEQVDEQTFHEPNTPADKEVCKICYDAIKNVCFVPCGHVVACVKCAFALAECPMCRATVDFPVRIYQV